MKIRERRMAWLVGGLVGVMILYAILSTVLLVPLSRSGAELADSLKKYNQFHSDTVKRADYQRRLNALAAQVYDKNPDTASRQLRVRLLEMARASHLDESELLLQQIEAISEKLNNIELLNEVGWNVTCVGGLKELTDFLYLIKNEPHPVRVDKLFIQPREGRTVKASFLCTTLVLSPMIGHDKAANRDFTIWTPPAPANATTQPAAVLLAAADRIRYNGIAERDLFSPYVPRPPSPVEVAAPPPAPTPPSPPGGPDYNRYRLAGLSEFGTEGELPVLLVDQTNQKGQQYGVGQSVLDLKIALVDYRPLPSQDQPEILSPSRLILQSGQGDYWAVELGQSLSQKRRLNNDDLPLELQTSPATAPAAAPGLVTPAQPAADTGDTTATGTPHSPAEQSEKPAKESGTLPHDES